MLLTPVRVHHGASSGVVETTVSQAVAQRLDFAQRTAVATRLMRVAHEHMTAAVAAAVQGFGDHVVTADALSSLAALDAALTDADPDADAQALFGQMRLHFAECLEMLHRYDCVCVLDR